MTVVDIDTVIVEGRHRKDLGDIAALADSIAAVGLLHPVVVDTSNRLVAGERRLAAVRSLGWTQVPVTVAANLDDAVQHLRAERDENICRREMTFSELLPLRAKLEELERPKAVKRRREHGGTAPGKRNTSGNLPEVIGQTRDVVAKSLGVGARTLDKVAAVHKLAEDPAVPEPVRAVAQKAVVEMDRTGKVDASFQAVMSAKTAADLSAVLGDDVDLNRLQLLKRYYDALGRLGKDLLTFDPDSLGEALDQRGWESTDMSWDRLAAWFGAVRKHRPPSALRVIRGGE